MSFLPGLATPASAESPRFSRMEIQLNPVSKAQQRRIDRVIALIEANFNCGLSRKEMAARAGMSVSHFSNLFSRQRGLSPHQYLVHCRLQHARKLLLTGEHSIAEVACESGFADQAHFTRHFRRAYGTTPLVFRHTARRELGERTNIQYSVRQLV
jgi:AraC family transcriptional regulator